MNISDVLAHVRGYAAGVLPVLSFEFDLDPTLIIRVQQPRTGEDALWRFPESTMLPKVYGTPPARITVDGIEYCAYALWPGGYALAFLALVLVRTAHATFEEIEHSLDASARKTLEEFSIFTAGNALSVIK